MSSCDESSITKNYIVQSPGDIDILSACTAFYTNNIYNCTGDTLTLHSSIVSANTINATTYLSGGTNILDILVSLDNFTIDSKLIGTTAYFDRTDSLSAYTLDLSSLDVNDTFVTSFTYDNANTFTISDNSGTTFNATFNTVTGLTINGGLSATTLSACTGIWTSNIYGCSPITVHNTMILENDKIIKASNGGGQLNLRDGIDDVFLLTNDSGYTKSWLYGDTSAAWFGFGYPNYYYGKAESDAVSLSFTGGPASGGTTYATIFDNYLAIQSTDYFAIGFQPFIIARSNSIDRTTAPNPIVDTAPKYGIFINASEATYKSDVENSVILGGENLTATTDNTVYVPNLNIGTAPLDNTLTQILSRDSSDGTIKYRDVDSIISAATSADTYVTGFTYDNSNTFTISDNSGSTFSSTINTVTGLTVNGTLSATTLDGGTILSGGTNLLTIIDDRDTFVTGTTFTSNQSILTRNDNVDVLKISGGTNVTITSGGTNLTVIDVTIPTDNNTFITGFTYDDINAFTITDNLGTAFTASINILSATTISATTFYGDGSNLSGITHTTDTFVSGGTYNEPTKEIKFSGNSAQTTFGVDLTSLVSSISGDTFISSFDYSPNTLTITRNDGTGFTANISEFSAITVTGLTVNSDAQFNDNVTVDGNTLIKGNVTILGTATTINSETVLIKDNILTLNSNATGTTAPFPVDSGLEILRNSATTSTLLWEESNQYWAAGLSGSTSKIILEGDSLSLLVSGHTHPIGEIIGLQSALDTKVSGATNLSTTGLFAQKTGQNLEFKGITSTGATVTITNDSTRVNLEVTIPPDDNTFITGFTYDDINAFTITDNLGTAFTASINVLSATTISATTFYGDGSNLSGVGGTFTGNTSGDCITDLYITNLYGCSPITVHDNIQHISSSATGINSIAWGTGTTASGNYSHAEGYKTIASGFYSHAEGQNTQATGTTSHAEGYYTTATGIYGAHAEGRFTIAGGNNSHAEGRESQAIATGAHAEGGNAIASGNYSHAEGSFTQATGTTSHAEGVQTLASGEFSHAEGGYTTASGDYSHAEGRDTIASVFASHAEGRDTTASGNYSHAEGSNTQATGTTSHAEGVRTLASGDAAHAEGRDTTAGGGDSHAEGNRTNASGYASHAEGAVTVASGFGSHSEGSGTIASGDYSHAEGATTTASGDWSHVGGRYSIAAGDYSRAGGYDSTASGITSFIHSTSSLVTGDRSVVLGGQNITGSTDDTVYVPNLNIGTAPLDNSLTQILSRDSSDGTIKYRDVASIISAATSQDTFVTGTTFGSNQATLTRNDGVDVLELSGGTNVTLSNPSGNQINIDVTIPSGMNTYVTGFTYDNINTFTIDDNLGSAFTASINVLSATTISATTYYGDGSNLTGISTDDNYVTGGTFSSGTLTLDRQNGSVTVTGFTTDTNTTVTGYTYNDANTFTISNSDGSNYSASINTMTGLTINGDLNVNGQSVFSGNSTDVVQIYGSGSTSPIFRIQGSSGELFSVTDSLVGELFAVNDISGIPILQVHSDNRIILGDNVAPSLYTTAKVTATSGSLTSIYSVPLNTYTGVWFEYTVKGTTSLRAGNIASIFSGTSISHNETTTTDIGDTSDLLLDVIISGTNAILTASATTSNWEIKTIIRSI